MNHGTVTAYEQGCRCANCRGANAKRKREWYRAQAFMGHIKGLIKAIAKYGHSWTLQGKCGDYDPNLWFSDREEDQAKAKGICKECPVRLECYTFAMTAREPWGIWGGTDPLERARNLNLRKRRPVEEITDRPSSSPTAGIDAILRHARRPLELRHALDEVGETEGEADSL